MRDNTGYFYYILILMYLMTIKQNLALLKEKIIKLSNVLSLQTSALQGITIVLLCLFRIIHNIYYSNDNLFLS